MFSLWKVDISPMHFLLILSNSKREWLRFLVEEESQVWAIFDTLNKKLGIKLKGGTYGYGKKAIN